MDAEAWERSVRQRLEGLVEQHLFRERRVIRQLDPTHIDVDGRRFVNFASNNYLGLSHHPRVIAAAVEATRREGTGAGASPLVTGHSAVHASAERAIAAWKGAEAAVLLPSGYQANLAAVQALAALGGGRAAPGAGMRVRFLLDKLVHASLVDAVHEAGTPFRVFPHNHLKKLERLLEESDPAEAQVVVTESVFSMDGDAAALAGLAELKRRRPFVLLLDEAHAGGAYGANGSGLAAEMGLGGLADLTVVTLSKGLGCAGGAVCGSALLCDAVVNFGRAYVYSTAVTPALAAAAEAAVGVLRDEPQRQQRLREVARRVRGRLREAGLDLPPGDSPIVPVIVGKEEAALEAASRLEDAGLWVVPIRPPTVPRGSSRLRITLCSQHADEEIEQLLSCVIALTRPSR
jgi:8-amino-7-oxononanoate synthase